MGIDPKECIYFKGTYSTGTLNSIMEVLLQKARIIFLDEVKCISFLKAKSTYCCWISFRMIHRNLLKRKGGIYLKLFLFFMGRGPNVLADLLLKSPAPACYNATGYISLNLAYLTSNQL